MTDNNDGTWNVSYQPTDPGKYHVDVILRNPSLPTIYDHVKNSPVDVMVDPGTVAEQCIAYGPGLENGILDTDPAHFTIEVRFSFFLTFFNAVFFLVLTLNRLVIRMVKRERKEEILLSLKLWDQLDLSLVMLLIMVMELTLLPTTQLTLEDTILPLP